VTKDEKPDDGLLAMIKRAIHPKQEEELTDASDWAEAKHEDPVSASEPVLEPIAAEIADPVAEPEIPAEPALEVTLTSAQSRTRTANEVQKMILDALITIPDAPKRGMSITVYGYRPWNAMVTFAPGSAKISTATMIRSALTRLIEEMRGHFDIEIPLD
jgi:hypothetical protein